MNFVRSIFIVVALLCASVVSTQEKSVGFDVGACSPEHFISSHIELSDKEISIISVSPGPDKQVVLPNPVVYKYESSDDNGRHYQSNSGTQIVIYKHDEKALVGKFVNASGETVALVFGVADSDGSKLLENAKTQFVICQNLWSEDSDKSSKF